MGGHKNYSEKQIRKALADVEKGLSVRKVAALHNISRTTLQRKLKDDGPNLATKRGPSTVFSEDQENKIAMWIKAMASAGFPVSKEALMYSIEKLAKEYKITFPGGNALPGRKWFEAFLRRHPNIRSRTSQNLTIQRLAVKQENIDNWFLEVEDYLKINKLEAVLKNPQRVFNCDETSFFLNPKPGKVLAEKGSKKIYTAAGSDEKLNLTVLLTGNAAGELAPPMIVYKYTRLPQQLVEALPTDWCIGKSENGWMTQETFYEYITNVFEPYLTKQNIQRPVILFMVGHSSHISLPLSTFCINHGIELVALFPNATHLLQPLDVAVFHTLKTTWRNFRMNHEGQQLQKCDFPHVLQAALQHVTPKIITNGFRACGLVPWDPKKVIVKKQKSEEMTPPTQESNREIITFFKILEEKIGEEKLIAFEANAVNGEWTGPIEQSDLFKLWKETKKNLNSHVSPLNIRAQAAPINSGETNDSETDLGNEKESTSVVDVLNTPTATCSTAVPSNVLSPFKRVLFWPENKNSQVKKRTREKLPAVVTSPQMIQYFKKKEEEKKRIETQKEQRRIKREVRKKAAEEKKRKRKTAESSPEELKNSKSKAVKKRKMQKWVLESDSSDTSDSASELVESDSGEIGELNLGIGEYVIVCYENDYFPGIIVGEKNNSYEVSSMVKSGPAGWKWPEKVDLLWYPAVDIVQTISPPTVTNSRGVCEVHELIKYNKPK